MYRFSHIRRLVSAIVASTLVFVTLFSVVSAASASTTPRFTSVAKQSVSFPAVSGLVWQATEWDAFVDQSEAIAFAPGFVFAQDGALSVFRNDSDRATRLRQNRALPIRLDDVLAPVAQDENGDASFLAIELISEEEALNPTGDAFDLEAAKYTLQLRRATLPGDAFDALTLDDGTLPALLVVVEGEIEVSSDDADAEYLAAGDALSFDGTLQILQASDQQAVILAVTIRAASSAGSESTTQSGGSESTTVSSASAGGSSGGISNTGTTSNGGETTGGGNGSEPSNGGETTGGGGTGGDPSNGGGSTGGGTADPIVENGTEEYWVCDTCPPEEPVIVGNTYGEEASVFVTDVDGDGLDGDAEAMYGTDPNVADTDRDDISDGEEVNTYFTSPTNIDTDADGLTDWAEINVHGTDPTRADGDFDGANDELEVRFGTSLQSPDTDGDCRSDGLEIQDVLENGPVGSFNPLVPGHPDNPDPNFFREFTIPACDQL